jgi:hypothetical protein
MLYDRLVNHDHLTNLVWVWEVAAPGFGPNATASAYSGFFPGLLYVDALELDVTRAEPRFRSDIFLQSVGVGKPIGIFVDGKAPAPSFFANETNWAWFVLASSASAPRSATANTADANAEALTALYGDPRVVSR